MTRRLEKPSWIRTWAVIRPTGPCAYYCCWFVWGVGQFWRRVRNGFRDSGVLTDGEDADRKGTRLQVDSNSEPWDHATYAHTSWTLPVEYSANLCSTLIRCSSEVSVHCDYHQLHSRGGGYKLPTPLPYKRCVHQTTYCPVHSALTS